MTGSEKDFKEVPSLPHCQGLPRCRRIFRIFKVASKQLELMLALSSSARPLLKPKTHLHIARRQTAVSTPDSKPNSPPFPLPTFPNSRVTRRMPSAPSSTQSPAFHAKGEEGQTCILVNGVAGGEMLQLYDFLA